VGGQEEAFLAGVEVLAVHKMKNIFLLFIIAVLSLNFAAAYPISIQLNGNMQFNTAVYHCSDSTCNTLGSLYASGSGNTITYTINNEGAGTQYFAEYDYVTERCYVSHSYKNWFDASTGNGPWQYSINLAKQNNCQSNINSLSFNQSIYDNQTQQITASIKSPLNLNSAGPQAVPSNLQYYYSTNVSAILEVRNQSNLVYTGTMSKDIPWGISKSFNFTLPLLQAGNYTLTLKTNVNDCMCSNYVEQSQQGTFTVLPQAGQGQNQTNQTNQTNQWPVANFVYTPQIPVINQAVTFNASSSYDLDGNIVSYFWNFGDGTNATGIALQHTYTIPGNYSVSLTVRDNNNAQSTIIRIIPVLAQPSNQTNQLPFANFLYSPQNPIVNQLVTFNASLSYDPDGIITAYAWNFGDGATATGMITQHSFSAPGDYPVSLTVTDNSSAQYTQSTVIRIVPVSGNQTNQTNQTTPTQQEVTPSKKATKHGDISNIAVRNFIFNKNKCGEIGELTFEVYNQQSGKMSDVKVAVEIPELNIKEESQFFNLGRFESNWVSFNIKLPNVQGDYYARIKITSHNEINQFIKNLDITCQAAEPITAEAIQQEVSSEQEAQAAGITGNVIAGIRGNATVTGIWTIFLILVIIILIIKLLLLRFQ